MDTHTTISLILSILTALGITGGGIFFYTENKRSKKAQAAEAEIRNEISLADEWRKVAEAREAKINAKDEKIDTLYRELSDMRNKYHAELIHNNQLEIGKAIDEIRICHKRGCIDREPQTGY